MLNAMNALVDSHDIVTIKSLQKQILEKYAEDNIQILPPEILAMLGIGTVDNIIEVMKYLENHPGHLSEKAEKDLRKNISKEFQISGKL